MGMMTVSKFKKYAVGNTLIETGTYYGGTINNALESGFSTIHTIEIQESIVNYVREHYGNINGVNIYHGDSPDILSKLCINLTEQSTFWLDSHYCAGTSGCSAVYGRCPLLYELEAIKKSPCNTHVIMIDDCRTMKMEEPEYPTIQQITESLFNINPEYKIFYIHGYEKGDIGDEVVHPYDIMIATTSYPSDN